MPLILSDFVVNRKQDDICGFGVPELNKVGVACVNQPSDIKLYVFIAAGMSFLCIPIETRISICCGLSAIFPFNFIRYDLVKVLNPK